MKVLLIDDHPLILSALQSIILGLGDHVSVVTADSAREARETLQADPAFDLVLLDLNLGDADGFDVLEEFRSTYPAVPVVVVSASDRVADVIRAIDLGAMGFVPKRSSNTELFDALRMVMQGGIFVPTMALGSMTPESIEQRRADPNAQADASGVGMTAANSGHQRQAPLANLGLTPRQTDVLALLLKGQPNKLIARELKLSVETVKDHVAAVLRALNVNSRTQAVLAVGQMSQQPGGLHDWRKN